MEGQVQQTSESHPLYGGKDEFKYRHDIVQTVAMKELSTQIRQKYAELKLLEKELLNETVSVFILPPGFKIVAVQLLGDDKLRVEANVEGLQLKKFDSPKSVDNDVYQTIKKHPNFIQIMSSGILTRAEKRKVLGLPDDNDKLSIENNAQKESK